MPAAVWFFVGCSFAFFGISLGLAVAEFYLEAAICSATAAGFVLAAMFLHQRP